jgi:hypothetical protein
MNGPSIRIIYQFVCVGCEKEEMVRCPYNPMQEIPTLTQSVPEGWSMIHFGDNIQTPVAMCNPCSDGADRKTDPRLN